MYTQTPERSAPSTPESRPGSSISCWSWATPDRRKKPRKEPKPEEWFSATKLLRENPGNISGAQFAGILLNPDVVLSRDVDCTDFEEKRRSGNTVLTKNTVMNFLAADDTAVIQVTLWNETVASFKRQIEAMPVSTAIIMEMKKFKCTKMRDNEWNGKILSSMQQIESVRPFGKESGTVLKLFEATSHKSASPFLQRKQFVMPSSPICIANFASLGAQLSPPCRGSFAGIVLQVSDLQQTLSKGDDKLDFTLIDDHGAWLQCCAIGINADTNTIAKGNRIVGFFGSGRHGIGSDDAKIMFFETDSTLVKIEEVKLIPCKQTDQCCLNAHASGS